MELKICPNCKSPYMASQKTCPRCGEDYEWNQESWLNVGCLILMMLFALSLILLPVLMLGGMLFRW
ncbi:MAG: hypothetical protein ABI954_10215 [Pyrinomonadaceae bacterium]